MQINTKKISATILAVAVLGVPFAVWAQGTGLIPCEGTAADPCDFNKLIVMANRIIAFIIYNVAVPLAALGFMFAGASLVLSQNKESAWTEAKARFGNIALGFGWIIAAFLLIKFILATFLSPDLKTFVSTFIGS